MEVTFDPAVTTYEALLDAFFRAHDPTQINRQGPDTGTQYRSAIFTHSAAQNAAARAAKAALNAAKTLKKPVATTIEPAGVFYRAEEYHQKYLEKRGMGETIMRASAIVLRINREVRL